MSAHQRERLVEVLDRRIKEEQCDSKHAQLNAKFNLNRDLNFILRQKKTRRVGEQPDRLGGFSMIAPGSEYQRLTSLLLEFKVHQHKTTID